MADYIQGSRGAWQTCLALMACLCLDAMQIGRAHV